MTSPTTPRDRDAPDDASPERSRVGPLVVSGLVAVALLVAGWLLPLWRARLLAPQYPDGLTINAYGNQVTGDVREINALNHYVGLGVFDPSDVPEMQLWPLALGLALVAVAVALLLRRRWPGRLATVYLWTLPVGVLAAIQFRLHEFGQTIEPGAAFRIEPFTPWVLGKSTVWNFETWAWPGWGLLAIVAAAAFVTFGPRVFGRRSGRGAGPTVGVAVLTVALALGAPLGGHAAAVAAADDHDHAGHGTSSTDDGRPGPVIGPDAHPAMPTLVPHPVVGDLADELARVPDGGTLTLGPGTYRGPVVIDRPVVIEGDGLPIIAGDGTGTVITVRAPGTVIRDVVVRGSGPGPHDEPAAIRIEADEVTVQGVVIEDSYVGIAVHEAAAVRLVDNHVHGRAGAAIADEGHAVAHDEGEAQTGGDDTHAAHGGHDTGDHGSNAPTTAGGGRGDGIWLHDADHVLIRGNYVSHVRDGVYISFGSGALIDGNHVHHSRYAVHSMFARDLGIVQNHFANNLSGTVLMYGRQVLVLRNHIERSSSASTGFAMLLKDVANVEAVENVLTGNRVAIHLDGPTSDDGAHFKANTIADNAIGVAARSSATATFTANSFVRNLVQVASQGGTFHGITWSDKGWGNFWDTYRGYDARSTGRGSVAHVERGAVDRLLLREPLLLALAETPAMRLLRSMEERWGGRHDVVLTDDLPLTVPLSPALAGPPPDALARNLAVLAGSLLALPFLVLLIRRPRRRPALIRRSLRAVPA